MKTTSPLSTSRFGPGQRINWPVHDVALAVSRLRDPSPAMRRAATIPALRQTPGADAFGGLVEFRDELPINTKHGDDGWLGLHLAACFGRSGTGPEAQLTWVFEREDLWHRISEDPLANPEWAGLDVKDPWSALAAAIEFAAFLEVGDGVPSRLPISMSARDLSLLMVDAVPAGFGLVPHAVLRARKKGMVTVDDGAGVYATHASNAWALAYFLRDAAEMVRSFCPVAPRRRRQR